MSHEWSEIALTTWRVGEKMTPLRFLRAIFLAYLTLLLVWFLPAHTRGRITMTPHGAETSSCCSSDRTVPQDHKPTESDKANCAVCFWAAGILPEYALVIEIRPVCTALIEAQNALDQYSQRFISNSALPRGPPVTTC